MYFLRSNLLAGAAFAALGPLLFSVSSAQATQSHGGIEGIVAHQAGHFFFMISMAVFAFWLRGAGLASREGWKEIYYAALFFILWNLDVFSVHLLDEQLGVVSRRVVSGLDYHIQSESAFLSWVYFFAKHDHVLCVPALVFFYAGLKKLLGRPGRGGGR